MSMHSSLRTYFINIVNNLPQGVEYDTYLHTRPTSEWPSATSKPTLIVAYLWGQRAMLHKNKSSLFTGVELDKHPKTYEFLEESP